MSANKEDNNAYITMLDYTHIYAKDFPPKYFALVDKLMESVPRLIPRTPANVANLFVAEHNRNLVKNASRNNSKGEESSLNEMEKKQGETTTKDIRNSQEPSTRELNAEEIRDEGTNALRDCSLNDIQIVESSLVSNTSPEVNIGKIKVKRILPEHINLMFPGIQALPNDAVVETSDRDMNDVHQVIDPNTYLTDEPADENNPNLEQGARNDVHRRKHTSTLGNNGTRIKAKKMRAKSQQPKKKEGSVPVKTRCGRIIKAPRNFEVDYVMKNRIALHEPNFRRDDDESFKCTSNVSVIVDKDGDEDADSTTVATEKRPRDLKYFGNHRCPTCNGVYLGKRLINHFLANPSHNVKTRPPVNEITSELNLYKFLVQKVKQAPQDQRAELFLMEITDLVHQLQSRRSRLVRDTSMVHVVGELPSRVLGIPQGNYVIDANAIDAEPEVEVMVVEDMAAGISDPPPRLDYNISLDIDDSLGVAKLNLPDNLIPSEESFLRTMDDFVEQGMVDLQKHDVIDHTQNPAINYDHATDNAVEATTDQQSQLLGILDLFQFTDN